ncbi:MAG: LptE family protein [bacterium]|nr:LptE family protein [bacterium]
MRARLLTVVLSAFLLQAVLGCGVYTFNPKGKSDISTIAVEPFENQTQEYGLTDRLTEVIIDAFISDGNLKIVPLEGADAVLAGTLLKYDRVVEKFDENDQVEEYKIVMAFEITLRNPQDQSEIWKERMTQEGAYNASEQTEEDGQLLAGERLVEAVINKTTKSW